MKLTNVAAAALGAGHVATFNLIGNIYLYEIFCLIMTPVIIVSKWNLVSQNKHVRYVIYLFGVILFSLVISDQINSSEFEQWSRGWARIIFGGMVFVVAYFAFHRDNKAIIIFLSSTFTAYILHQVYIGSVEEFFSINFLKAHVNQTLLPMVALFSFFFARAVGIRHSGKALMILGAGLLLTGFRSFGISIFLAGVIIIYYRKGQRGQRSLNPVKIGFVAVLATCVLHVGYVYYGLNLAATAPSGQVENREVLQLLRAENPYNPLNVLKYGRTETFVGLEAALNRPLFGYGSWPEDPEHMYNLRVAKIKGFIPSTFDEYLPAHSVLVGSWVWGGMLCFLGVSLMLIVLVRESLRYFRAPGCDKVIVCVFVTNMIWNFAFSPFGHIRETIPFAAALILSGTTRTLLTSEESKMVRGSPNRLYSVRQGSPGPA